MLSLARVFFDSERLGWLEYVCYVRFTTLTFICILQAWNVRFALYLIYPFCLFHFAYLLVMCPSFVSSSVKVHEGNRCSYGGFRLSAFTLYTPDFFSLSLAPPKFTIEKISRFSECLGNHKGCL